MKKNKSVINIDYMICKIYHTFMDDEEKGVSLPTIRFRLAGRNMYRLQSTSVKHNLQLTYLGRLTELETIERIL